MNLMMKHFPDFGEFCKLAELDRKVKFKISTDVTFVHWLELKKKIINLNLDWELYNTANLIIEC